MRGEAFLATTAPGLARASRDATGAWRVERVVPDRLLRCVAVAPGGARVYAGGVGGIQGSDDGGATWRTLGLETETVTALATSPAAPDTVWAGTKPARLHVSRDGGATWSGVGSFERMRRWWWWWTPSEAGPAYVQAIAASPVDARVLQVGIEVGGVLTSLDEGATWTRARGAIIDCHALAPHPNDPTRVLEGGAGLGAAAAVSRDGGRTWRKQRGERGHAYGWAVAWHPTEADVSYWAASTGPRAAHGKSLANALIYRSRGDGEIERLTTEPLVAMPYALLTDARSPDRLWAALSDGTVLERAGDEWRALPFSLPGVARAAVRIPEVR